MCPKEACFSLWDFAKVETACEKYYTYTPIASLILLVTNPKLITRNFKLQMYVCEINRST